jgi:DNA-binding SARP family transcriptional activator
MLRLTTFGGVGMRLEPATGGPDADDQRVQRRGLAVLVLLAAAPEAGVSRDTVAAYLWPESDQEHARNALRQTLFTLRRDLDAPALLANGLALRLNHAVCSSDVREFESARARGDLERVAALHAGPFLDGFHLSGAPEFERWVDRQRAEYAGRTAAALEALARAAAGRADAAAAAEWWRRLSLMDPLNTRVALELVAGLAAAGNPAAALRHARDHDALVREELGTGADPAMSALVARIREGSVGPRKPMTQAGGPGATGREDAAGRTHDRGRADAVGGTDPVRAAPQAHSGSAMGATTAAAAAAASDPPQRTSGHGSFIARLETALAGRYAFESAPEIGRDGSARLIRARDLRHDRPVTLKVVQPALASVLDVERFLREIKLTARLQHPHILPLYDSGEVDGRPWYATARPAGETLRARLARDRELAMPEALQLAGELADALEHAHANGVLHRDVTPENVLLAGGHAILTNLGIARALDAAAGPKLTETGVLVGTPAYMSPEQATDGPVDRRTDVYALGCVLFEMLSGEPVFSGPTSQAIMAKRAAEPALLPSRLAGLPPGLARAVAKAVSARPRDRYASAAEFSGSLLGSEGPAEKPAGWRGWLGMGS